MSIPLHIVMIIAVMAFVAIPVFSVRSLGIPAKTVCTTLGAFTVVTYVFYNIYYFWPGIFKWSVSLPLHVCDLLALIACISLLTGNRKAGSLIAISAVPFASQAVLTPVGNQDPVTLRFWLFWALHAGILATFAFGLLIQKTRPQLEDLWFNFKANLAYIALLLPVDLLFGWNYGYIGMSKPGETTVIDVLGPWPWRVLLMLALAMCLQTAMYFLTRQKKV